jgi:hypothetical protein
VSTFLGKDQIQIVHTLLKSGLLTSGRSPLFFQIPPVKKAMLRLPPTSHYGQPYSEIEDYESKEQITPGFTGEEIRKPCNALFGS